MSQIIFEIDETLYTLEFDKESAMRTEKRGFNLTKMGDEPLTQTPLLIYGAFIKHHPFIKTNRVDEIIERVGKKRELITKLAEMYAEPINELFGGEEEDESKKVKWEAIP